MLNDKITKPQTNGIELQQNTFEHSVNDVQKVHHKIWKNVKI